MGCLSLCGLGQASNDRGSQRAGDTQVVKPASNKPLQSVSAAPPEHDKVPGTSGAAQPDKPPSGTIAASTTAQPAADCSQAADAQEAVETQAISNLSCIIPKDVHDLITANLPRHLSTQDMRHLPPYAACAKESTAIGHFAEQVLTTRSGPRISAVRRKTLGRGGYGVVTLCEHLGRRMPDGMPRLFALKELISPTVFPLGQGEAVADYLPLKEAAIQEYMAHQSIVQIYWADVRCLHPLSCKPLPMSVADIVGPDAVVKFHAACRSAHKSSASGDGGAGARGLQRLRSSMRPMRTPRRATVKLQMRMGIEFCDLGTLFDYLVVEPDPEEPMLKPGAPAGGHGKARPLRDALLAARPDLQCSVSAAQCVVLAALDVAEALRFMHRSATLHGDLKPQNILLASVPEAEDPKGFRAKISDFGLSQHLGTRPAAKLTRGSKAYLPLEALQHMELQRPADIYALGLLMWEMVHGVFWHALYEKRKHLRGKAEYTPAICRTCPPRLANLIAACLHGTPEQRPSAGNVVRELNECFNELRRNEAKIGSGSGSGSGAVALASGEAAQRGQNLDGRASQGALMGGAPAVTPANTMQFNAAAGETVSQPFMTATQAAPATSDSRSMAQHAGAAARTQAQGLSNGALQTGAPGTAQSYQKQLQVPQASSAGWAQGRSPEFGGGAQTQPVQGQHYSYMQPPADARVTAEVLVPS